MHLAVVSAQGRPVLAVGEPERMTFYRSAAKPMQALPLVEEGIADRLHLTEAELSLCCASHEGEPAHVDGSRSILAKAGVDEALLRCGPHAPYSAPAAAALAAAGEPSRPIHNNCSGKHAGMLALAVGMGWDPHDYHRPDHPVQERMLQEVERWTGRDRPEIPTAVDGCGVVCFAAPLETMALSFARFAEAAAQGAGPRRIVDAMTSEPFMVGGTDRACTEVMRAAGGSAFVKLGAEGVYGGGVPDRGWGFALKVEDGGRRAVEAALASLLVHLELVEADDDRIRRFLDPPITNTRGDVVGSIRPRLNLAAVEA